MGEDGGELFNRALVTGEYADGSPMSVRVSSTVGTQMTPGNALVGVANPRADVNTSGWTPLVGAIVRDTSIYDPGGPTNASFRLDDAGSGVTVDSDAVSQALDRAKIYRLTVRVFRPPLFSNVRLTVLSGSTVLATNFWMFSDLALNTWTTVTLEFSPLTDVASYSVRVATSGAGAPTMYFDNVLFSHLVPTRLDRLGIVRTQQLPISGAMPVPDPTHSGADAPRTIGDLFLAAHRTTPFRGTVTATGDGAVRDVLSGTDLSPGHLLTRTNEILRMSDRVDPDTGGWGRDGRLVAVSYTPATQTASLTIDSSRSNLAALLSRMDAVVSTTPTTP